MSFDSIMFCYFRYGLPVNFHAVLMQPHKKHTKKLHELLNAMYSHLDTTGAVSKQDVSYSDITLFFQVMCVEFYVVCLCLFILCHDKVLTSDEGQMYLF